MRTFRIYIGLIILLVATGTMFGQGGATGSILGTVTDSTGAVMPGVKVTVTNTGTNVSFHTVTSSAGDYLAPSLDPGTYSVSAVAKDFQKATTTVFTLAVDQQARVNLSMTPGAVTSTVEVQAQTVALDTDRSEEHTSELQSRQYLVCRLLL